MLVINSNAVILSLNPAVVYIHFSTQQIISDRTFKVYRKQSDITEEIGEIKSAKNMNVYGVTDRAAQLFNLHQPCYYKVSIVETGDETGWFSWDTMYRVFEAEILNRQDQVFHYDMGSPMFLHSERIDLTNVRCPNCWDITTQMSLGKCNLCMNTGRQKPYLDPTLIWCEFGTNTRALEYNLVETETGGKRITMSGLPKVKPGDIFHEPFKHELWRVENVGVIGRDTAPVMQQASVSLVKDANVAYTYLTLSDQDMSNLLRDMNSVNNERRF